MKTKTRLLLSLGALTFLVFILAGVGIASINQLRGEGGHVLRANYMSLAYMEDMLAALEQAPETGIPRAKEQLALQQANITEVGEQEATTALAAALAAWETSGQDSLVTRTLTARIRSILELNRDAIVRKAAQAEERGDKAVVWITLAGTLCALIALSMLFGMAEFLSAPIRALTAGIDRVAQGNYRERIILDRNDEFGHMADRFNAMAGELEKWENSNLSRILEEKTRAEAVIQSLQDASIGVDEQGHVLFANQQALDLLEVAISDIVGRSVREASSVNDLLRVVLSGERQGPLKIVKEGREHFYTLEHVPIFRSGLRLGTVAVLRNITPFEEKDRAKTHFLATISHELKTPLASTDIGLSLLERQQADRLTAEQAAIVSDLRKDHQRLVRIVSELLNMAQAESGKLEIQHIPFHLDAAVEEAILAVQNTADQRAISITHKGVGELPAVLGDSDKTVWVLVNLLGNAIRYAPAGSAIDLMGEESQGSVRLAVRDQGPGVPLDLRSHIFERFIHGHARTEPHAGLGLAICREFMNAMGGSISYRSDEGAGATFVLTFVASHLDQDSATE